MVKRCHVQPRHSYTQTLLAAAPGASVREAGPAANLSAAGG
ncbi:hypothetical protein C4K17_4018 [Pseudomonas chlororaphis subsp. aurantiaca]|nr:hypothetical protein C4K17_4018 [Pseudomonas chlororaphis subsp. aurantiaca]